MASLRGVAFGTEFVEGEAREVEGKPRMGGWERRSVGKKKVWTDPRGK